MPMKTDLEVAIAKAKAAKLKTATPEMEKIDAPTTEDENAPRLIADAEIAGHRKDVEEYNLTQAENDEFPVNNLGGADIVEDGRLDKYLTDEVETSTTDNPYLKVMREEFGVDIDLTNKDGEVVINNVQDGVDMGYDDDEAARDALDAMSDDDDQDLQPEHEEMFDYDLDPHAGDMFADEEPEAHELPEGQIITTAVDGGMLLTTDESSVETVLEMIEDATGEELPDVDFMVEFLTSFEMDEGKRGKFFDYLNQLDQASLATVWETFKASFGPSKNQILLSEMTRQHIQRVENSQSLALRNENVKNELQRMGTFYSQLARTFRSTMTDTPLNEFRVDNLTAYIASLQRDLTTVSSAVTEMAEMLLIGHTETNGDSVEMAINPKRAVHICGIVGHSAKTWAKVYETAGADAKKKNDEIAALKKSLEAANSIATAAQNQLSAELKRLDDLTLVASSYFIGNHNGHYLTTINEIEGEEHRISPFNLRLTQDKREALALPDLEAARKLYDTVQVWSKRNIRVRKMFKRENVVAATLFIGAESITRVEG